MRKCTITRDNLDELDRHHVEILASIGCNPLRGTSRRIWNCPICGGCLERKKKNGRFEFSCKKCKFKGNLVELYKVKKGFQPYPEDTAAYYGMAQELCEKYYIDVEEYVPNDCDNVCTDDYDVCEESDYDGDYIGPYGQHPAKETEYAGCVFRSRLEARWAVFFDAVGIRWQYENQKYYCHCHDGEIQLDYGADFYLPDYDVYVEVKGTNEQLNESSDPNDPNNPRKIPAIRIAHAIDYGETPISKGLILLGELPYSKTLSPIDYFYGSLLYYDRGVCLSKFRILTSADRNECIVNLDKYTIIDCVNCIENKLPDGTTVNLSFHETHGLKSILDVGLQLARQARFDFMDSVEKMVKEGRNIIGGIPVR